MKKILITLLLLSPFMSFAQDGLDMLNESSEDKGQELVFATFKGSHIINFQSVEVVGKRTLEFMIQHRFGELNGGAYTLFGLDGGANIRFGLSYSLNGRLEFGLGRTNYEKLYDGYVKYRVLRQNVSNKMPVSLTFYGGTYYTAMRDMNAEVNGYDKYHYPSDRLSYAVQFILARKFSENLSVQLSPSYVHYNLVEAITDKNDIYALGAAFRYKFTKRMAITAEYGFRSNSYTDQKYYDTLGLGLEIETGGHVFQMFLTNSAGIAETQFIPHTSTTWKDGGVRLGFNVTRAFNL